MCGSEEEVQAWMEDGVLLVLLNESLLRSVSLPWMNLRLTGAEQKYMQKFLLESFLAISRKGDKWP